MIDPALGVLHRTSSSILDHAAPKSKDKDKDKEKIRWPHL